MLVTYRPKAWHLLIVALIAVFDAAVLYMVLFPNVTADYRAYYIDRTASCFPRADNVATGYYPFGEPINFITDNTPNAESRNGYSRDTLRYCGFMPPSTTGIRSFGDYGIIRFKGPFPQDDLLLTLASWTNTGADKPRREVQVLANGEPIGTLVYTTRDRVDGKFVIPQRLVAASPDGYLQVRFNVPRIGPPGTNSEPVTLQLRLEAMRLTALHDPDPAPLPPGTIIEDPASKEAGSPPPPKNTHKRS